MKEYFRGIVHGKRTTLDKDGKTVHKYIVAGLLITEDVLPEFDVQTAYLDGSCPELSEKLLNIKQRMDLDIRGDVEYHLVTLGEWDNKQVDDYGDEVPIKRF